MDNIVIKEICEIDMICIVKDRDNLIFGKTYKVKHFNVNNDSYFKFSVITEINSTLIASNVDKYFLTLAEHRANQIDSILNE